MIKIAYSFFIGILLAFFVGMGIAAFYAQPKGPEYPSDLMYSKELTSEQEQEQQAKQKQFDEEQKKFDEEEMKPYNRNVSMITLAAAVIYVAIGLVLAGTKYAFFSDGFMLGGIFTLMYSLGRGFAAQDSKYSFIVTTVGLIIVFALGYLRFFKEHQIALETANSSTKKNPPK